LYRLLPYLTTKHHDHVQYDRTGLGGVETAGKQLPAGAIQSIPKNRLMGRKHRPLILS